MTVSADDIPALELDYHKRPQSDAFVPLVEAYLRNKRYMEAMVVCKKVIKNLSSDPRGRLLLARVYIDQGKPPKAEQELHALLAAFPEYVDGMILQAGLYKSTGRKSEAIQQYQKVLAAQPGRQDIKDALKLLGVEVEPPPPPPAPIVQAPPPQPAPQAPGYFGDPQPPYQQPAYQEAAPGYFPEEVQEAQPPPRRERADTLGSGTYMVPKKKQGNPKTTLYIVLVLVAGVVGWLTYYINHVQQIRKIDGFVKESKPLLERNTLTSMKQALESYQKILDIDSGHLFGNAASAYVHEWLAAEQGVAESKAPADKFLGAADLNKEEHPYRVAVHVMRKLRAGDVAGAASEIETKGKAVLSAATLIAQGEVAMEQGKEAEAKEHFQRASALGSDNMVLSRLGDANIDEGKYEAAKGYYDQVLNLEGGHPGALIGRIVSNFGKKVESTEAADKDLEKLQSIPAEYLTPRWHAGMLWVRGLSELKKAKPADAKKSFEESEKEWKPHGRMLMIRGKVYASVNMHEEASRDFAAVLEKRKEYRPAQVGLALSYSALNKQSEAMTLVDQLLAKDPNDVELQLVKGRALRAQNKVDDAIAAYQKVLAGKSNIDAKIELMGLYRAKKEPAKTAELALATIKAGEAKARNYALVLLELGRAYLEQNDAERARSTFNELLTKEPSIAEGYFFIGKTLKGKPQKEAMAKYLELAPAGPFAAEATKLLKSR